MWRCHTVVFAPRRRCRCLDESATGPEPRVPVAFGVLLLLCLVVSSGTTGCAGGDEGVAGGTLTSSGSGETSQEPLWPLRPGASWSHRPQPVATGSPGGSFNYGNLKGPYYGAMGDMTYVASPPRRIEGREVTALHGVNPQGDHNLWRWPHQPDPLAWWSTGADGALFHGQLRGALSTPVLFAPAKARVGMRWHAKSPGGDKLYDFEVVSRTVRDTPWGRRPVWRIRYTDYRNYVLNYYHERVGDSHPYTVDFVEGRGPLEFEPSLRSGQAYASVVVPLEDPMPDAKAPSGRDPVSYPWGKEPMGGGLSGMVPGGLSMTMFPGEPDVLQGVLYGRAVTINLPFGSSGDPSMTIPTDGPAHTCLTLTRDGTAPVGSSGSCLEAQGVAFDANGEAQMIGVSHVRGVRSHIPFGKFDCNDGDCADWEYSGIYRALDDTLRILAGTQSLLTLGVRDTEGFQGPFDHHGRVLLESGSALRFPLDTPAGLLVGAEESNHLTVALVPHDGTSVTTRFHETYLGGTYNVLTTADGQRIFRTSPDGRVEELMMTAEGVEVVHLAEVDLAKGELLGGAVAWGEDLLVVINQDFQGATDADAGAQVPVPKFGNVVMGLVHPRAGEPHRDNPLYGLVWDQQGADEVVCWPPGHGAPDLEGWTLGGAPATLLPLDDRCVLVVRDGSPGASYDLRNHEIVGPIPGAGRTSMASPSVEQEFVFPICGALSDGGGCVALEGTLGPGLVRLTPNAVREIFYQGVDYKGYSYETGPAIPDRRGGGLWYFPQPLYGDPSTFYRFDGEGPHEYADEGSMGIWALEDGGIVRLDAAGAISGLRADGSVVTFPGVEESDEWSPSWFFQDGTVCGIRTAWDDWTGWKTAGIRCLLAGAAEPTDVLFPTGSKGLEEGQHVALSPTVHYLATPNLFTRIDVAAGTVEPIRPAAAGVDVPLGAEVSHALATGPAGRAFALLRIDKRYSVDWELLEITAEGPEIVDVPRIGALPDDSEPALFVDADFFVFQGGIRAPRDP